MVTGGRDGKLRRFDVLSGEQVDEWAAHEGGVWSLTVAVLPDGAPLLVSGGADSPGTPLERRDRPGG